MENRAMVEKHNVLASEQGVKNTIKAGKEFADATMDRAQITALLKAYHLKYGEEAFVKHLISSYADIRGGIAFNDSKGRLQTMLGK